MFRRVTNTSTIFENLGDAPELKQFDVSLPPVFFPPSLTQVRHKQGHPCAPGVAVSQTTASKAWESWSPFLPGDRLHQG